MATSEDIGTGFDAQERRPQTEAGGGATGSGVEGVEGIARKLSKPQRYHVERGCISGDFQMSTVRALKAKGLMYLHIDSPNGQCGFMRLTPLGEAVRAAIAQAEGQPQ